MNATIAEGNLPSLDFIYDKNHYQEAEMHLKYKHQIYFSSVLILWLITSTASQQSTRGTSFISYELEKSPNLGIVKSSNHISGRISAIWILIISQVNDRR